MFAIRFLPSNSDLIHEHEVLWAVFLTAELFLAYYEIFQLFCMSLVILEAAFQRYFPNRGECYRLFLFLEWLNIWGMFSWITWAYSFAVRYGVGWLYTFAHRVSQCCRHGTDEACFFLCQSWGSLQFLCCLTMVVNLQFPQQRSCTLAFHHHAVCTGFVFEKTVWCCLGLIISWGPGDRQKVWISTAFLENDIKKYPIG